MPPFAASLWLGLLRKLQGQRSAISSGILHSSCNEVRLGGAALQGCGVFEGITRGFAQAAAGLSAPGLQDRTDGRLQGGCFTGVVQRVVLGACSSMRMAHSPAQPAQGLGGHIAGSGSPVMLVVCPA